MSGLGRPLIILGLILLRLIFVIITVGQADKKFGEKFELWIVPLLDFIYAFYYLVTGIKALATKKVRWKN